jgi:hypothetical protein
MLTKQVLAFLGFKDTYDTIGTDEHLAVGLSMGLDKPTTGQAFLVGPSKARPVDHWFAWYAAPIVDVVIWSFSCDPAQGPRCDEVSGGLASNAARG